jgi:transposase
MPHNYIEMIIPSGYDRSHVKLPGGLKMQKLVLKDNELMHLAIQQEIARSDESRYDHRLHGLLLVSQGYSCYDVADLLGQDPRTIERWVKRFDKHGFGGLQEGEHPGRPTRLGAEDCLKVEADLRCSPRDFGYGQNLWDGKLLAHHLTRRYYVTLGVRQCQRLFGQFGFRRRKPRPVIAKGDPVEQAAYKKTSPPGPRRKT